MKQTPETERARIAAARNVLLQLLNDAGRHSEWLGGDFQRVRFEGGDQTQLGGVNVDVWDGSEQFGAGDWRDSSAITLIRVLHGAASPIATVLGNALDRVRIVPSSEWTAALAIADGILAAHRR